MPWLSPNRGIKQHAADTPDVYDPILGLPEEPATRFPPPYEGGTYPSTARVSVIGTTSLRRVMGYILQNGRDTRGPPAVDSRRTSLYIPLAWKAGLTMKLSISEARRRLPALVRQVKNEPGTVVQIAVRDEVVAELRAQGHKV